MRNLIFIPAIAISYVLLTGWPQEMNPWLRSGIAVAVTFIALMLWRGVGNEKKGFFASLRKPNLLDYLFAGLSIVLLEFFFMTLFTFGPEISRDFTYQIEEWVREQKTGKPAQQQETTAPDVLSQGNGGNWLWNSHYQRSIPKRANHKPRNRPEVFVTADSPEQAALMQKYPVYVRAFTLNHFDGESWYLANPIKRVLDAKQDGFIQLKSSTRMDGFPVFNHTITHSYHQNGQNVLLGMHGARQVKLPYVTRIAPDIFLLPPKKADQDGYVYEVNSQPVLFEQIVARGDRLTPGSRDDGLDAVYFDTIPDALLRMKMRALLDGVRQEDNLTATLIAMRNMLQSRCEYSLKVDNPDELSPLDNFLFAEQKGYCEHFASATASLCRELDIPCRIAFGWAGGKFYEGSNQFMFVSADAHAWTEIYLKDFGWVVFDTTGPDQSRTQIAGSNETPPALNEPIIEEQAATETPAEEFSPWTMLGWAMGVGFLILGSLVFLKFRTMPARTHSGGSGISYEEPDYIKIFRAACSRMGCPYPDNRTLRKQMHALDKRHLLPDFGPTLLEYHNNVVYGVRERDGKLEKAIIRLIKQWNRDSKAAA